MNIALKPADKKKKLNASDMYEIMQKILLRENRIDRNREHLWTICLDTADKLLNIELVSMGSINKTIIEPMEVFSVPLQKRAVKLIIVHNHPSGQIMPSAADKDVTDRLIQCGLILNVPVADHLIIAEKTYYSFAESGLLTQLELSKKYVPDYKLKEQLKKEMEVAIRKDESEQKARAMAKAMKQKGYAPEEIAELTGLSKQVIQRIKI
jgi:DNA repair protein RadC